MSPGKINAMTIQISDPMVLGDSYPKITSGLGIEGFAARKFMMVWEYATEMEERRGAVWKEPALKKYGDSIRA